MHGVKASLRVLLVVLLVSACHVMADDSRDLARVSRIRQTLDQIILPELTFRDATLQEELDFLAKRIREHKIGVAIVLQPKNGPPSWAYAIDPPTELMKSKVPISLTNVSLARALRSVCEEGNLKYIVQANGLQVVPRWAGDPMFRREFRIPRDFFPAYEKQDRLDHTDVARHMHQNPQEVLAAFGASFDEGASAQLNTDATRLTVRNTESQLDLVSHILAAARPPSFFPNYGPEVPKIIAQGESAATMDKLQRILLPEVKFEGTRLSEVVQTLRDLSVRYDTASPRDKRGVNIVLEEPAPAPRSAPRSTKADPRDDPTLDYSTLPMSVRDFDYAGTRVSLLELLEAVARRGQSELHIDRARVTLRAPTANDAIVTLDYLLPPDIASMLCFQATQDHARSEAARSLFIAEGAQLPPEAMVVYQPTTSRLTIRYSEEKQRTIRQSVELMWRQYYDDQAGKTKTAAD
jgi:hypothetical protein